MWKKKTNAVKEKTCEADPYGVSVNPDEDGSMLSSRNNLYTCQLQDFWWGSAVVVVWPQFVLDVQVHGKCIDHTVLACMQIHYILFV